MLLGLTTHVDDTEADRLDAFLVHRFGGDGRAGVRVNPVVGELLDFDTPWLVCAALVHAAFDVLLARLDRGQVRTQQLAAGEFRLLYGPIAGERQLFFRMLVTFALAELLVLAHDALEPV